MPEELNSSGGANADLEVFEPQTVAEAAKMEKVWDLKDSSGDLAYLARTGGCVV